MGMNEIWIGVFGAALPQVYPVLALLVRKRAILGEVNYLRWMRMSLAPFDFQISYAHPIVLIWNINLWCIFTPRPFDFFLLLQLSDCWSFGHVRRLLGWLPVNKLLTCWASRIHCCFLLLDLVRNLSAGPRSTS